MQPFPLIKLRRCGWRQQLAKSVVNLIHMQILCVFIYHVVCVSLIIFLVVQYLKHLLINIIFHKM